MRLLGGTPIRVGVVHVEDPGTPEDPSAGSRPVAVLVTDVFHGADPEDADPQPAALPAGFVIHDALGTVHEPAPPTEDCDAWFGDAVAPGDLSWLAA